MIPSTYISLNNTVVDLNLPQSSANLNHPSIRARAKKYSGPISLGDLSNSVTAIMPTFASSYAESQTGVSHSNGWEYYDPWNNYQNASYSMVSNGDASQGMSVTCQHIWNMGGDCTMQVVCHGTVPINNYGKWRVEGVITPISATLNTYMKWELIGWSDGFYKGSPFYMYSLDNIRTTTDLASYSPYIEGRSSFPYVCSNFHAVVKSEAPSYASMSGTITGHRFWYGG